MLKYDIKNYNLRKPFGFVSSKKNIHSPGNA